MVQSKVAQHLVTALENLRKERGAVETRIATLEKLLTRQSAVEKAAAKARAPAKKRGRPAAAAPAAAAPAARGAKKKVAKAAASKAAAPKAAAPKAAAPKKAAAAGKKKPNWSPAAREAARKRMQEYWSKRRKK